MKKLMLLVLCAGALSVSAAAEVTFSGLDVADTNRLLFSASVDVPTYGTYSTLFSANLDTGSLDQLTYFPEDISLLLESGRLQIQNRFGVFQSNGQFSALEPVKTFASFVKGNQIQTGKLSPISSSPDGKYLLYLNETSPAYADLVLYDTQKDRTTTIAEHVEYSLDGPPVSWSPQSDFFIYSKDRALYYFSLAQFAQGRLLSEQFRSIGPGTVANVRWGSDGQLYYVSGQLVYRVLSVEFFTRSLYQNLLKVGTIIGKIPFQFDPNFDHFWISPLGDKILLDKGGRNLFLYFLQPDDYLSIGKTISLPYLFLPRNTRVETALWTPDDRLTVLTQSIVKGGEKSAIYRLDMSRPQTTYTFTRTDDTDVREISLDPADPAQAVVLTGTAVLLKDYATWQTKRSYTHPEPLHAVWDSTGNLIVAGRYYTELIDVSASTAGGSRRAGESRIIALSQPEQYGFSQAHGVPQAGDAGAPVAGAAQSSAEAAQSSAEAAQSSAEAAQSSAGPSAGPAPAAGLPNVLIRTKGIVRAYDLSTGAWSTASSFDVGAPQVATDKYRVYLEPLATGSYANMVMVRHVQGVGTTSLFNPPETTYEPFPDKDESVSFSDFTHGSRIRRREVALVFNAINSVEGLTTILNVLKDYNVHATFFLNGDFIRQNPGAAQEIADSGQEVGSLFFTYFNLTDSRYQITSDFVQQGLARNEDDYFNASGHELSLIWHAPYYFANPDIISAAGKVNYTYVGRDVDSLDWVPKRDANGISSLYKPAAELVEKVIQEKKPGSIISMTVGRPVENYAAAGVEVGPRDDYLFEKLDILINDLIQRGYTPVTVSTLMEHAK